MIAPPQLSKVRHLINEFAVPVQMVGRHIGPNIGSRRSLPRLRIARIGDFHKRQRFRISKTKPHKVEGVALRQDDEIRLLSPQSQPRRRPRPTPFADCEADLRARYPRKVRTHEGLHLLFLHRNSHANIPLYALVNPDRE